MIALQDGMHRVGLDAGFGVEDASPSLGQHLQDLLLFLQLPAGWAAVSRAGPPFLALEPPLPHLEDARLPTPNALETRLGSTVRWPHRGEVAEQLLPAPRQPPSSGTDSAAPLRWYVGGFAVPNLDPTLHSLETLYLHLVAWIPDRQSELVPQIFGRCLRRLEEASLLWGEMRHLERLASLGQLLAIVSHEVRNDLSTVRASLQLGYAHASSSVKSIMDQAIQEVDQAVHFMELLLRTGSPRASAPEPITLARLVEETLRVYRGLCHVHRVDVRTRYPPEERRVLASAVMLRHALGNLVRNALEAMPKGGVLTVEVRDRGRDRVEVAVTDSGPGLSDEARQRIFQPFATSKPRGTGLGLALVRQIAVAHGGEVTVDSRPGEGATFSLVLPLASDRAELRNG